MTCEHKPEDVTRYSSPSARVFVCDAIHCGKRATHKCEACGWRLCDEHAGPDETKGGANG